MIRCWSYFYNIKPSAYPNQRWVLLHLEKVSYHIPLLVVISCQREHCQYISCDDSHASLIILITRVTTMTVVKYNILNNKTLTATMTVAGYNEPKGKPWIRIMNCAVKSQFRLSSLACLEVKKKDYFRSALFPGFLNDLHFSNWVPLMHNIYPTDLGSCETLFGCAFETSPQKSVMDFRFFNYSWLYFGYNEPKHSTWKSCMWNTKVCTLYITVTNTCLKILFWRRTPVNLGTLGIFVNMDSFSHTAIYMYQSKLWLDFKTC